MKRFAAVWVSFLFLGTTLFAQPVWKLDKEYSSVRFQVENIIVLPQAKEGDEDLTMGVTRGKFRDFSIKFKQGAPDFSNSKVEVEIQANSVDTDNGPRDAHLRSDAFFNAEQYPLITFKSRSFKKTGKDRYSIVGDLTLHGITHPIKLEGRTNGMVVDNAGRKRLSFKATGRLNRRDYGLTWSSLIENGAFRISSYVQINIQANFVAEP